MPDRSEQTPVVGVTHTPGPWFAEMDVNGDRWIVGDPSTWVPRVAKVPPYSQMPNAANARLIAAAPDLLAALINLVNSFEKHRPKEYWDAARAAIAKAEGR